MYGLCYDHNLNCGYPRHHKQKKIWNVLVNIKDSINDPWAILGDFNEILLHPYDKIGEESQGNTSKMQDFGKSIDNYQLLELESFDIPNTWFDERKAYK